MPPTLSRLRRQLPPKGKEPLGALAAAPWKGIPTGSPLWSNRNSVSTDHLSVTIDGATAY